MMHMHHLISKIAVCWCTWWCHAYTCSQSGPAHAESRNAVTTSQSYLLLAPLVTCALTAHADSNGRHVVVTADSDAATDSLEQRSKPWTFVGRCGPTLWHCNISMWASRQHISDLQLTDMTTVTICPFDVSLASRSCSTDPDYSAQPS